MYMQALLLGILICHSTLSFPHSVTATADGATLLYDMLKADTTGDQCKAQLPG